MVRIKAVQPRGRFPGEGGWRRASTSSMIGKTIASNSRRSPRIVPRAGSEPAMEGRFIAIRSVVAGQRSWSGSLIVLVVEVGIFPRIAVADPRAAECADDGRYPVTRSWFLSNLSMRFITLCWCGVLANNVPRATGRLWASNSQGLRQISGSQSCPPGRFANTRPRMRIDAALRHALITRAP